MNEAKYPPMFIWCLFLHSFSTIYAISLRYECYKFRSIVHKIMMHLIVSVLIKIAQEVAFRGIQSKLINTKMPENKIVCTFHRTTVAGII